MNFHQLNLFFLIVFLALQTSCNVGASKVSENQVASDLTIASNDIAKTSAPSLPSDHLLHSLISTSPPSIKSDITIKNNASTNLASPTDEIIHHSVSESPKVAVVHENKVLIDTTTPPIETTHIPTTKSSQLSKFHEYLKPVCEFVDEIQPKQLSKVQSQFKQLVHLSAGKLATCFLENYKFDPTSDQITKQNLKAICSSDKSITQLSNSFETCAKHNWSPLIDAELDKIATARANHTKTHEHSKGTSSAMLEHDKEEEVSFVTGVVNKFFGPEKSLANANSNISILDISVTTPKPSSHPTLSATSGAPTLLNDPNTFVVFVDPASTTAPPDSKLPIQTSHKPTNKGKLPVIASTTSVTATSTTKSSQKSLGIAESTPQPSKPALTLSSSSTSMPSLTVTHNTISPSTSAPSLTKIHVASGSVEATTTTKVQISPASTSMKPLTSILTTKKSDVTKKITKGDKIGGTSKPNIISSTTKPSLKTIDTFEEILKRQEKEKQELEQKLKSERENFMKQLQKKQDEIDAQIAVKALQHQRDASGHSDAKLHQIEHERQMSIDPVGHTLKHQQYELNKQQKMFAGK